MLPTPQETSPTHQPAQTRMNLMSSSLCLHQPLSQHETAPKADTDDTVVMYASVNTSARGQQPEGDPADCKAIRIIYAELPTSRRMASPLKLMPGIGSGL
ncbi:hypothetical protein KUDE01_022847 [Dissostichus eleginoides]|uniref:Uncharacterized protein n=1 Tax=Dissostichus eleginoides TaxID=100907 RepID=A0AAD9BJ41_DISEL|nr:hypothetical protein KUDE01_022847 [Dissostichus eleginoides]